VVVVVVVVGGDGDAALLLLTLTHGECCCGEEWVEWWSGVCENKVCGGVWKKKKKQKQGRDPYLKILDRTKEPHFSP
jgi:hypothetical protein